MSERKGVMYHLPSGAAEIVRSERKKEDSSCLPVAQEGGQGACMHACCSHPAVLGYIEDDPSTPPSLATTTPGGVMKWLEAGDPRRETFVFSLVISIRGKVRGQLNRFPVDLCGLGCSRIMVWSPDSKPGRHPGRKPDMPPNVRVGWAKHRFCVSRKANREQIICVSSFLCLFFRALKV